MQNNELHVPFYNDLNSMQHLYFTITTQFEKQQTVWFSRMELPAVLRGAHMVGKLASADKAGSAELAPTMEESAESGGQPLQPFLSADVRQPEA